VSSAVKEKEGKPLLDFVAVSWEAAVATALESGLLPHRNTYRGD